mmetsp:Transcript_787/g.4911  ORF Transcript_787/g.4911 Transcript_787/m.4911 type:complete len:158 (-) Transcript_787:1309-1782(-)
MRHTSLRWRLIESEKKSWKKHRGERKKRPDAYRKKRSGFVPSSWRKNEGFKRRPRSASAYEQRRPKKVMQEPEAGPGITSIAIKLPDGSRKLRKFHATATVEQLYDYVDSLEELHSVQYQLHSNFPREAYGRNLKDKKLEEVGLCPNAMLFLQPEDT